MEYIAKSKVSPLYSRVLFSLACISGASLASSHKMQYFIIILEAQTIIGSPETVNQTKHTHFEIQLSTTQLDKSHFRQQDMHKEQKKPRGTHRPFAINSFHDCIIPEKLVQKMISTLTSI